MSPTISQLLSNAVPRLAASDTPSLEAQLLVAHVLGVTRTWVLAHPEGSVESERLEEFEELLTRLEGGEPLPYLLGSWEFFGLPFAVSPDTLIPRPETELLVEHALGWLQAHPKQRRLVDVGTGTGCIAISLGVRIPDLKIWACDLSISALQLARENARRLGTAAQMTFIQSDLLGPFSKAQPFDLITANLPYIPSSQLHTLPVARWEPVEALDGGVDGLAIIRRLLAEAPPRLAPGGLALLEIEANQGSRSCELARKAFPGASVQIIQDLAGNDRLIKIENGSISDQ